MLDESIGYYALLRTKDGKGYIGSLLVVDRKGKPLEFRVTYPVKPTKLQIQLYGESLLPHIGLELCGGPLYKALEDKPGLLLVNDPRFLDLAGDLATLVVHAQPDTTGAHLVEDGAATSVLRSPTGVYDPIAVRYPASYDAAQKARIEQMLERAFLSLNPVEPFQRITAALNALQANDDRFS